MNHEPETMNQKPKTNRGAILLPFIRMIGRHWPAMVLGGWLALLATMAAIGLLSLSGWFIAATAYAGLNVATAKAFNFFLPSIGVRLFAIIRTAARYGERVICHDATFRILETLRTWCYTRLEPLSPALLGRHHSGDLLTRVITDIDTLDNLYLRVISPTVVAAVVVALLAAFISIYDPQIALLSTGLLMAAGVGIPMIADQSGRSAARRLNEQTAQLRVALVDGIHGLAALLASGAERHHLARVDQRHQALVQDQQKMSQITGLTGALMGLFSGLAVVGTLYIGVEAVSTGGLSGPHLALLVLAVTAGFEAVVPLSNAYQYLGQTRKAADRLNTVTQTPPAVTFSQAWHRKPADGGMKFDRISFRYARSDRPALDGVSFELKSGRRLAIMGPTGSGKSTMLYLLARFEDPSRGTIRIGHCNLHQLSEQALRKHVCIIDQKAHIFNGTVRDNLLLANPQADDRTLQDALAAVRLLDFVSELPDGLDTWVGEAGRLLSGGQARRLAIARAVTSAAAIWAFDEPTEGLDTETAKAMMTGLLARAGDRTVIMVTHRAEMVEQMDQVLVLNAGRIEALDTPEKLKNYSTLYRQLISV
ncbi:MAG: thiol reductant ABC exporter subunit CydC [Desulfobacteraceae bacterium]|jgi:ATP-binding cassette subfamily C protein CydC